MLRFACGYARIIAKQSDHLRADDNQTTKLTLDLMTICLFSIILHGWARRQGRLDILSNDSERLEPTVLVFDVIAARGTRQTCLLGVGQRRFELTWLVCRVSGWSADNPPL